MSQGKNGLRTFGLALVAALGLMAFVTSIAQANWLILLADGTVDTLPAGVTQLVTVSKHTKDFSFLVASVPLKILCQKIESNDLLLEPGTATTAPASGKIVFRECTGISKSEEKEVGNCKPAEPIEWAGKFLVILHTDGQNYILFEPNKNAKGEFEPFTTIKFSELCALTETTKVTGEMIWECGVLNGAGVFIHEDCKIHHECQLMQQAPEALFPNQLRYGNHVMTVDGILTWCLVNPQFGGLSWSGEV